MVSSCWIFEEKIQKNWWCLCVWCFDLGFDVAMRLGKIPESLVAGDKSYRPGPSSKHLGHLHELFALQCQVVECLRRVKELGSKDQNKNWRMNQAVNSFWDHCNCMAGRDSWAISASLCGKSVNFWLCQSESWIQAEYSSWKSFKHHPFLARWWLWNIGWI